MTALWMVPGLWNSGPEHWQRHWQREHGALVVEQTEWEKPRREDWVAAVEAAAASTSGPLVLAGHSTGCATLTFWAASTRHAERVRGVLLVGPSDPEADSYPAGPTGFAPMPLARLPFPARVVASSDDPFVTFARARQFAAAWGAELSDIGPAGHINSASGHGPWPEGFAFLTPWLA